MGEIDADQFMLGCILLPGCFLCDEVLNEKGMIPGNVWMVS